MKVLVTGAFGLLGTSTIEALLARGHEVRAFDIEKPGTVRAARLFGNRVETVWGDIRSPLDVDEAACGTQAAVHLAFILPPLSERDPGESRMVNVDGTAHLIQAMKGRDRPTRLVFSSTFCVYGITQDREPPLRPDDAPAANNHYTRHKLEAEDMVRTSGLDWTILRFGVVLAPVMNGKFDPVIFDIAAGARYEMIHSADAARAVTRCLETGDASGRTLLIGGGPECRVRYAHMINATLGAMGLPSLPEAAFTTRSLHGGDWMDTALSQDLLHYQSRSFARYIDEVRRNAGLRRHVLKLAGPFILRWMLSKSPYL
jgi:UDP-glucose 4-epimerase